MIRINLLPHKKVKTVEKSVQRLRIAIVAVTAVIVLALGYWTVMLVSTKSDLTDRQQQTARQLTELKNKVKEVEGYEKSRAEVEQKLKVIQELEKKKVPMTPLLNGLNAQLPKEVWFTTLQVNDGSFSIDGMARDSRNNVNAFYGKLETSPLFADLKLVDVKEEPSKNVRKFAFKISGRIAGYGQGAAQQVQPPAAPVKKNKADRS